jgi:hypothetical protein
MVRVKEEDRTHDATCFERAEHAGAQLEGRTAPLADSMPACDCNDAIVVDVDDLLELHVKVIEVLGPSAHELHEPVAPDIVLHTWHADATPSTRSPLKVRGGDSLADGLVESATVIA